MAWWSPSWLYKCPITLTNNSGNALSDYQVLIELTPSNFHYEHCKEDGGDIRFINASEDTKLPYWVEEWNYNGASKIWVKVDSIPTGSNICLYLYYGNDSALSESDGEETFLFFDDCESGTVSDKWQASYGSPSIEYTTEDKYEGAKSLKVSYSSAASIVAKNVSMADAVFEAYVKAAGNEPYNHMITGRAATDAYTFYAGRPNHDNASQLFKTINGSFTLLDSGTAQTYETFHKWAIRCLGSQIQYLFDDEVMCEAIDSDISEGSIGLRVSNGTIYADLVRVRKYVDPEPTYEIGSEVRAVMPSYTFEVAPLFEADLKHNNTYITGYTLENTPQAEACMRASHQEELNISPVITDALFGIGSELLLTSEIKTAFGVSVFSTIDLATDFEQILGMHFVEELSQTQDVIASPLLTAIIGGVAAGNLLSYRVTQEWGTYDTAEVRFKGIPHFRAGDYIQIVQEDYYTKHSQNIFKGVVISMDKTYKKNFEETVAKAASFEWYLTKQYCFWNEYTEHASLSSDINAKRYIKYWLGGGSLEVGTEGVHWDLITGVRPFMIEEVPNWAEKYCKESDCSFNFFLPGGTTKWDAIMQICDACDFVFYCTYSGSFAKRYAYFRPRNRIEEGYYPFGEQLTIDATDESWGFNKRLLEIRSRESQSTPDTKVNRVAMTCRDFDIVYKEHPFVGKAGGYKPIEVHRGVDWANIESVDQLQDVCDKLYEWLRKPNTVYEAKLLSLVELADGTPLHTGFKIKVQNVEGHPEDVYRITKITHEKKGEDPIAITTLEYRDVDLIHFGSPKLNEIEIIADVIESRVEKGSRIPGHPCPQDPRSVVIGDFPRVEHGTIVAVNESENTVDIQINRTGQIVRGVPIT